MTVRWENEVIYLEESCAVEEAETLLELLLTNPGAPVDWSGCRHIHTSLLQVLMAVRPPVQGVPRDAFLEHWIGPALAEGKPAI
ncbi:hypothetical protein [Indioceanicola profundi]|uniref:hypothetical protein n=1 Tax=Indioceanicola profundi TaxID=2220096 RepID=UPI000E6A99A9|nr:hypothetical protein [Indioceanicola profundi]